MRPDPAGGCKLVLLLLLLGMVLTRTGAVPVPRPLSVSSDARHCHVAQFKSLSPVEMQAFKTAKDAFEEQLLLKDSRCNSRLFPRAWDLQRLQVWERPVALQAELALTLEVLGSVTDPALEDVLERPLRTLAHIHAQLRACVPAGPTAAPRPRSHLLSHWLQRLNQATKKESPGCLQASVISNLFRLLTRDLRCVARPDLCA
ncbi:interferon lambda-3 [Fukomys damarensis]|uniref:interferon lambda-3 n=1 Tax=Fukomys damarensis TaxID=885580 RepID=UPI0008FEDBFD|nr:interferon lambda-3 [Fukomys damarensis]